MVLNVYSDILNPNENNSVCVEVGVCVCVHTNYLRYFEIISYLSYFALPKRCFYIAILVSDFKIVSISQYKKKRYKRQKSPSARNPELQQFSKTLKMQNV